MTLKKIATSLMIASAFGLTACGDDSSSASDTISCKSTITDSSYKHTVTADGMTASIEITIENEGNMKVVQKEPLETDRDVADCKQSLEAADDEALFGDVVSCDNKTMVIERNVSIPPTADPKEFLQNAYAEEEAFCKDINGKKLNDVKNDDDENDPQKEIEDFENTQQSDEDEEEE